MENAISRLFNQTFSHWDLRLPQEALETRQRGKISGGGWGIQYLFGEDERGRYLDYYATNRMTSDSHVRIYESGEVVQLEAPFEFSVFPKNATEEEKQRIIDRDFEENRRIYAALQAKGFS